MFPGPAGALSPIPGAPLLRSPGCHLNVIFAFAIEYPETLDHDLNI